MINPVLGIFLSKELRELRANPQIWPGYLILPLIAVALPIIFLAVIPTSGAAVDPDLAGMLRLAEHDPLLAAFPDNQRLARLLTREAATIFLFMPVLLSGMSAALAIAAEKQQRTLEPILATPVSVGDLLAAKLLAALGPAVLVTWGTALVSVIATAITTQVRYGEPFWPGWAVVLVLVLLAPACGAAAALLGMRASIRAKDVQPAVQMAGLWVVPLGVIFASLLGRPSLRSVPVGVAAFAIVVALGWWLFRGNIRRFEREELLTRWA